MKKLWEMAKCHFVSLCLVKYRKLQLLCILIQIKSIFFLNYGQKNDSREKKTKLWGKNILMD